MTIIAWVSIAGGCFSAGAVLYDIYIRGLRQPMRVMEAVWPLTAVYLGALGWLVYTRLGRPEVRDDVAEVSEQDVPEWQGVTVSATHCGAGCALGNVIGEWVVFAMSLTVAGAALWPEYILDLRSPTRSESCFSTSP